MSDEKINLEWIGRVLTMTTEMRDLQLRFSALEDRFAAMESRFGAMETRIGAIERRFHAQEERMSGDARGDRPHRRTSRATDGTKAGLGEPQ
jgi:hypothetical protein